MKQANPFVIEGYVSPEYFCDRKAETTVLMQHIINGRNVALIAPRRMGKSGLIQNCFHQKPISDAYYLFYVDIYETKNLSEFVYELGKCVLNTLKPFGRKVWEGFINVLQSLRTAVTFDINGNPEWSVSLGDIVQPDMLLDEIFDYLAKASRPCLIAIDEFQVIASYPEKTVEAALRKRIQNCHNARFIYSGSKRHMMAEMFASSARPFYNSCSIMGLEPIDREIYFNFAKEKLRLTNKDITQEAFWHLYDEFGGVTWYIQYVLNMLYALPYVSALTAKDIDETVGLIISQQNFAYKALIYQLPTKQKQLLLAIARENKITGIMSKDFLRRHSLTASMVQGALKGLLDRDFITFDNGVYQLSDTFLMKWLQREQVY